MTLSRGPPGLCTLSRPGNPGSRLKPGSPSRLIGRSSTPQNEFVPLYAFYIRDRLRIPRNNFHPKFSSRISLDQVYLAFLVVQSFLAAPVVFDFLFYNYYISKVLREPQED
jgi:hypothetical protein